MPEVGQLQFNFHIFAFRTKQHKATACRRTGNVRSLYSNSQCILKACRCIDGLSWEIDILARPLVVLTWSVTFFFFERCAQEGGTCHGSCCVYTPKTHIPTPKIHWPQLSFLSADRIQAFLIALTKLCSICITPSSFELASLHLRVFYPLEIDISNIRPKCSARLALCWDNFSLACKIKLLTPWTLTFPLTLSFLLDTFYSLITWSNFYAVDLTRTCSIGVLGPRLGR